MAGTLKEKEDMNTMGFTLLRLLFVALWIHAALLPAHRANAAAGNQKILLLYSGNVMGELDACG